MHRRHFIQSGLAAAGLGALAEKVRPPRSSAALSVMTVNGLVETGELGRMLPHEHVLVDFAPIEELEPGRYDPDAAFDIILPHLESLKALGCQTVAECTPAYLGPGRPAAAAALGGERPPPPD